MQISSIFLHLAFLLIFSEKMLAWADNSTAINSISSIAEGDHITKLGCLSKCGNLTVPYPFGIGINSGCSINQFFDINCNASFDPPKAFLGSDDELEVLHIYDTKIRIKSSLSFRCYDQHKKQPSFSSLFLNLSGTPFSFSKENSLYVVGCNDFSFLALDSLEYEDYNYISSCVAMCNKTQDVKNGSCSGIGCCQASIPTGLQSVYTRLFSLNFHANVHSFNPCGYAFLAEENSYVFQVSDVSVDPLVMSKKVEAGQILIDWAIGNKNCSEINSESALVCEGGSACVDSESALGGYRCNCSKGYKGNPYLSPGCQDINECEYDPCHAEATCSNVPGSYSCYCNHGYVGDGRNDSIGCILRPPSNKITLYAGLLVGLVSFFALISTFALYKVLKKRKLKKIRQKLFQQNGGLLLQQQISDDDHIIEKLRVFTAKELEKATDRFNNSRILGRGGQGIVYKGMLSDGRIVAVKKSKQVNEDQQGEFINEVVILSQINHKNVVKLIGCCLETQVPLLVYDFISNGTLFDLIHNEGTGFTFTWDVRLRIAAEVANALAYLHYVPIYHRDMKTSNVLLDEKYRAKLADFGISRSMAVEQTHLTTKVKGTFGYLDPEYFQTSKFTEKSDVYSFGVILVELLTGEKPISTSLTEEERSLVMRFLLSMEENRLNEILDCKIKEDCVNEEHIVVAKLAQRCLNLTGKKRPNVREVAMELESIRMSENRSFVESENSGDRMKETESLVFSYESFMWTYNVCNRVKQHWMLISPDDV